MADTLEARTEEAIRRITSGMAPMRLPADECDADLVLTDLRQEVETLRAKFDMLVSEHITTQAELAEAQTQLKTARTWAGGVWFWQGDGKDALKELVCPVVMKAETLRGFTTQIEKLQTEAVSARAAAVNLINALDTLPVKHRVDLEHVVKSVKHIQSDARLDMEFGKVPGYVSEEEADSRCEKAVQAMEAWRRGGKVSPINEQDKRALDAIIRVIKNNK